MKNNKIYLIIILITMFITMTFSIVTFIYLNIINSKLDSDEDKILNIRTIESLNCDYKPELYYETEDYNIYTYCLDSIQIVDYYTKELSNYIYTNPNVFENLFKNLTFFTYWDGGTKEYKDYRTPNISNNGITIIKCNGRDEYTNDIYIGPASMYYKENFCKKDNTTHTKTFKVLEVEKDTLNYVTLTLEYKNTQETLTIHSIEDLQKGLNYDFEFMGKEPTEDTIKSIFENSRIVEIRKSNN